MEAKVEAGLEGEKEEVETVWVEVDLAVVNMVVAVKALAIVEMEVVAVKVLEKEGVAILVASEVYSETVVEMAAKEGSMAAGAALEDLVYLEVVYAVGTVEYWAVTMEWVNRAEDSLEQAEEAAGCMEMERGKMEEELQGTER